MKISDDESLFAWIFNQEEFDLLAAHPSYFTNSESITIKTLSERESRPPYLMTNKELKIAISKKHFKLFSQDDETIRFFLRCSRASNRNTQKCDKALYIELRLIIKQRFAIRTECVELKETDISPDKSEYLIGQLDNNLAHNKRIYIFSPDSEPSSYWGPLLWRKCLRLRTFLILTEYILY